MNKYCNLDGTKKIREDFPNINTGFAKVEADMTKAQTDIDNLRNLTYTGSEHDALVTSALVDSEGIDFGPDGEQTYLNGRLEKWEGRQIAQEQAHSDLEQAHSDLEQAHSDLMDEFNTHKADNAAHGVSHKNLLHNWDFRNPVNQRGESSYTSGYTIDRWKISGTGTVTVGTGSISLASTSLLQLQQILEDCTYLDGQTVTVSAEVGGVIYSATGTLDFGKGTNPVFCTAFFTNGYVQVQYITASNELMFRFVITSGQTVSDITRVKLEIGDKSTLANDSPADYGEQLALCQRYYQRITSVSDRLVAPTWVNSSGVVFTNLQLPTALRTAPTVTISDITQIKVWDGASNSLTAYHSVSVNNENTIATLRFASNMTAPHMGMLQMLDGYIELSADL